MCTKVLGKSSSVQNCQLLIKNIGYLFGVCGNDFSNPDCSLISVTYCDFYSFSSLSIFKEERNFSWRSVKRIAFYTLGLRLNGGTK